MKKILLVVDGSNYSKGALEFAKWLNEKNKILLVGLFIPKIDYGYLWTYAVEGVNSTMFLPITHDIDNSDINKTIETFVDDCKRNDIQYRVHKEYEGSALSVIMNESRFADLLLLGSETFYNDYYRTELSEHIKDTLHEIECPAIILPEKYRIPIKNVVAYDGSKSSVFALKQFIYLFPEFANNETILVNSKSDSKNTIPNQILIEELATKHFDNLTIFKNNFEPESYFDTITLKAESAILISGAYGRGGIGGLFHTSFLSNIIKKHGVPVFVTHK
jgi:nucleotide-binding universal stress UspA family protein